MTVITPRIASLSIGPPDSIGLSWSSNPDRSKCLYWEAEIEKTGARTPSEVKAEIYNLSPTSLRFVESGGLVIIVSAGEGVPSMLTYADIPKRGVMTERKGADYVTKISAAEGQRIFRDAKISLSYPAGTARSTMMINVAAAAQLVIGYQDALVPERVFPSATTLHGSIRDVLGMLWDGDDCVWWLDGKTLYVLGPNGVIPGNVPLISPASGMHGSPTRTSKGGIEVTTNLLPGIRPGGGFGIQSRFATGSYKASKVHHKLNSWGTIWETKISGKALK